MRRCSSCCSAFPAVLSPHQRMPRQHRPRPETLRLPVVVVSSSAPFLLTTAAVTQPISGPDRSRRGTSQLGRAGISWPHREPKSIGEGSALVVSLPRRSLMPMSFRRFDQADEPREMGLAAWSYGQGHGRRPSVDHGARPAGPPCPEHPNHLLWSETAGGPASNRLTGVCSGRWRVRS